MRMMGDVDSTPNIKIEKELLQGIADAAVASDAWIITNGYKEESISELIGEVVYNSRIKNPDINFSAIAIGFYKSSKKENQKTTDHDEALSDYEDDMDIAMIDEVFPQDGAEISLSSAQNT
ncbi:unnamed protein product [Rotaria sp. Silwood1]|nr:unnamed protein product [Rotaria sp. Silwood1]CAF0867089.1 unnamed protein product [Rotaria sp. Silwood1]CAF0882702.1 unnamed protein product [Rotaria sp. Silwood1]CAF3357568.1 unnamed protein product [Rotaria sp. Silwood1]CAF3384652.1 unnamed protein product [Rotaria sp. Silwood1]